MQERGLLTPPTIYLTSDLSILEHQPLGELWLQPIVISAAVNLPYLVLTAGGAKYPIHNPVPLTICDRDPRTIDRTGHAVLANYNPGDLQAPRTISKNSFP